MFVSFTNKHDCIGSAARLFPSRVARTRRASHHGLAQGSGTAAQRKVLPEHARGHNRSLVLQTLYAAGTQSRADIARETGLTRVTVSDLVAELIADGLVSNWVSARTRGRESRPR